MKSGAQQRAGGYLDVLAQQRLELRPCNHAAAETLQVSRGHLAVDYGDAVSITDLYEVGESDLGGVPLLAEHGFAKKDAAEAHSIQTTDQHVVAIRLDAAAREAIGDQ